MGLFGNKPKAGGLMDVIRCDEPSYLIWKWHPAGSQQGNNNRENAIRWGSSLRVKDGEAAVFVYQQPYGITQDIILGPCDEILATENLPVLAGIIGLAYQGGSPFQAEVYFINLARAIQVPFAVPYFDLYDSRFADFGVPTAVRGKVTFNIADCQEFIKLHRLTNFNLNEFQVQIRDAMSRYVKSIVMNVPEERNIPVIQIERAIEPITQMVQANVKERFARDFGVNIVAVDISAIEIDKTSDGYNQLMAVSRDMSAARIQAENEDYTERLRIHREEEQYAMHKQTQTANIGAVQLETQKDVGIAGAEALGRMGANGAGGINYGNGGAGLNPATMMAGIALGGAVGQNIANTMNGAMGGALNPSAVTPPPIPTTTYYVAVDGKPTGPYTINVLTQMAAAGTFRKENLVWKIGMSNWAKAGEVPELNPAFANAMPPIPSLN